MPKNGWLGQFAGLRRGLMKKSRDVFEVGLIPQCKLRGRTQEILWVDEGLENNVATAMLKSWVQKEQIIQKIFL